MQKSMEIKERTCIICGKSFVPYTSSQVYCSAKCSTLGGDRSEREKRRYQTALAKTADARTKLENKQQISISDAARLLNVSRPTIYKLIDEGTLSPHPHQCPRHPDPERHLQHLIPESKTNSGQVPDKIISKDEALTRYGISETWLYRKTRVLGIRSTIVGGKAYFPKKDLDRLFPPKSCYDRKRWITLEDLERTEGLSEKRILTIAAEHEITREKVGRLLLLSLPEWKKARELISKLSRYYMTREQATSHYHIGNIRFYDGVHGAGLTPVKSGHFAYYKITDLDKLFKNKEPNIPKEIRRELFRKPRPFCYQTGIYIQHTTAAIRTEPAPATDVQDRTNFLSRTGKSFRTVSSVNPFGE